MITGKYPPDPCDGGVCQMPENIVSPGNKWFTNDLTDNDTVRKRRDVIFEDGEIARAGSWPWVVAITGNPKQDYCHVGVVPSDDLCAILNYTDANLKHAEYNDLIGLSLEVIQEMAKKFSCVTQSVLSDPLTDSNETWRVYAFYGSRKCVHDTRSRCFLLPVNVK